MSKGKVRVEREGRVATLTIDRPAKKNALNVATWRAFHSALVETKEDPGIHVVLVTGAGGNFCAGNDVTEMRPEVEGDTHPSSTVISLISEFDKPLFAAVEGVAVGFGLSLILHSDFVFIAPDARLRAPFVEIGVVPEAGSTYLLPARVGPIHAAEIFFGAEFFDGERAFEIGLVHQVVAAERLLETAQARAKQIAAHPLAALQETKRLLIDGRLEALRSAHQREREAFIKLLGSRSAAGEPAS
jgi:enoyl-CoA hydratase/carnithine racemase